MKIMVYSSKNGFFQIAGKVMMPLAKQPLLWHILQRIKKVKLISEIIGHII